MKNFKKILLGSLIALSSNANAELINADWKEAGDGLAVYDTESGLTWLDLTVTKGMSIIDANEKLKSDFIGFGLATKSQVTELLNSMNPYRQESNPEASYRQGYNDLEIIDHLSFLFNSGNSELDVLGHNFDDTRNDPLYSDSRYQDRSFAHHSGTNYHDRFYLNYDLYNITSSSMNHGVWLVKSSGLILDIGQNNNVIGIQEASDNTPSVPLGSTSILLGLGLAGLGLRRKIK